MKKLWLSIPPRRRKWGVRIAVAFAVYSVLGFFIAPAILKSQLVKRLPGVTKRTAGIRQVRMNPWTLSLTIRDLHLTEPDGATFASWEEFYVNFQASSLFRWAWTFKEIRLVKPFGAVILQKDGRLNFANMFPESSAAPAEPAPGAKAVPRLRVFALAITNGFLALEDHTRRTPFRTEYRPINILLTKLTTRPGTATPYSFRAQNDSGQSLTWSGDIVVEPFSSHGSIGIVGAEPMRYQPYFEDFTTAQVVAGRGDVLADYWFSAGTNGVDLTVSNASFRSVNFEIRDPAAQESVLKVPTFAVEKAWLDLRTRAAGAGRVALEKAQVLARRERDGSVNLLNLLVPGETNAPSGDAAGQEPAPPAPAPWTLIVETFEVKETSVKFRDLSGAAVFETQLDPIEFKLEEFTTGPEKDARFYFSVQTEAKEELGGSGTVSINPVRSAGEVKLSSVQLPKYWPYLEPFLKGGIQDGQVDVTLPYRAALGSNSLQAAVSNVLVRVSNLRVRGPDSDETLLSLPAFTVENAEANLEKRLAKVARVKVDGGSLLARRTSNGNINLQSLLKTSDQETAATPATVSPGAVGTESAKHERPVPPRAPWTASIDEIDLSQYAIVFEDLSMSNVARVKLDRMLLNARGISTRSNQSVALLFSTQVNETGDVAMRGEVCPMPARAEVEIGVTNVDLCALQPYLDERVNLTLTKGFFGMYGKATWQADGTNPPPARFTGGFELTQLQANDRTTFQEFVQWGALRIGGVEFSMQPNQLKVAEIAWDGLKTSLLVDTNKQVNLLAVMPAKTNAVSAQPESTESAPKAGSEGLKLEPAAGNQGMSFPVAIERFVLTNASFHFGDASIQPPCLFDIQRFSGTIDGLSSDPASTATLDLRGHIDEQAPFAVIGRINPLSPVLKVDVTISNSNIQLPAFTPYMEKFAGHPLNKGRLALDLRYEINDQELKAQNKFRIDQLMLGPRNESPDATKLPVKLAVALLKDRNGVIEMDVPVAGRLDDPQFRVGKIVFQVVLNLITKAATSPFKLLGALVGGGEELSFVEFAPGTAILLEGETNKIDKLVRALVERPAINLEISAGIDPHRDREFMARQNVRAGLKQARLQELAAAGQNPDPETFELDPVHQERLMRSALVREYGTNLLLALQEFAAAQEATNAAAATNRQAVLASQTQTSKRLIARFVGWLPIYGKNSPTGAARRQAKTDAALLKDNPELATVAGEDMEGLLASRTEVPSEELQNLMRNRTQNIQQMLLEGGAVSADRLYLIGPKAPDLATPGLPRATLSIN